MAELKGALDVLAKAEEGAALREGVYRQKLVKFRYECGLEKPPPEEIEQLRTLGYLGDEDGT